MTCNCKIFKNRLERLEIKYSALRKEHKKLLGLLLKNCDHPCSYLAQIKDVTMVLTDVLEEFIRGGINNKLLNTLDSCSMLHSDVFKEPRSKISEIPSNLKPTGNSNSDGIAGEKARIYETTTESEREYYEGFLARPRIPRTPQQH